ncbi:uncharacterized protein LOC144015821 [Festucalex cinctus]
MLTDAHCTFLSLRIRGSTQRPPEWRADRHHSARYRTQENPLPHGLELNQHRTVPQPRPSQGHPQFAQEYHPVADQQNFPVSTGKLQGPPEVQPRRRVSADQIYAAHKEARLETRQASKEEVHTEGLLKSRKAVLPSEIRRREKTADEPQRVPSKHVEWQISSPEQKIMSRGVEEDWHSPRERRRERNTEKIRERGRHRHSGHETHEDRVLRPVHPENTNQPESLVLQMETRRGVEEDLHRQHQYNSSKKPQEPKREHQSRQEARLKRVEDIRQYEPQRQQELQWSDSAVYLQKGSSLPQAKHKSSEAGGGPKPKTRTRSMSDIGISQHSVMYRRERAAETSVRPVPPSGMANGETGTLDTRVSVAQLRHSYLENANRKPDL